MNVDLIGKIKKAITDSELVRTVASVRRDDGRWFALGTSKLRRLSRSEIAQLESLGNSAEDWTRLRVVCGFDARRVRHSTFQGQVVLGRFVGRVRVADGLEFPTGIYRSTLADCVIGNDALIHDVSLLANYVIGAEAVIFDCGTVLGTGAMAFGNGQLVSVGVENGDRDLPIFAEIDVQAAAAIACRHANPKILSRYGRDVAAYVGRVACRRGIIASKVLIRSTLRISNSYVGPGARVDGATALSDSTILSSRAEPARISSGSCVTGSLLQWGSHVGELAVVEGSVLTEHSEVRRHGKVLQSILGPNTVVAGGEVTASLVGPFVSLRHQALLIATVWPEGKGSVSAGACVGANHTSRAPDQEFWPGEGCFFGLGVNVKFPSDFRRAPYTVIAAGVTALPQKMSFPFSLMKSPAACYHDISRAYNQIIPAWLLTDNLFALKRNIMKHQVRNRARRSRFPLRIFRPETVDLMRDACRRLETVRQPKEVYTDQDIDGLGKNFLLEVDRQPAIDAYRFYTTYYALLGLKSRVEELLQANHCAALDDLLTWPSDQPFWEHQRRILFDEMGLTDVAGALEQLPGVLEEVAQDVERSKARDDERGKRIVQDYNEVHAPAAEDPVVRQTWQETNRLTREVHELIANFARHC